MKKYAYTTLVAGDVFFLEACCLYFGLQAVKTKYPIIFMITEPTSQDNINFIKEFAKDNDKLIIKEIEPAYFNNDGSYYDITLSKFAFFDFKEYDKIMFLDSDTLPDSNIDSLFDSDLPMVASWYDDTEDSGKAGV